MLFLVLAHVEAVQGYAHGFRELPRELGLADAGGSHKEKVRDRLVRAAEARAAPFNRLDDLLDRAVLPEDGFPEPDIELGELSILAFAHRFFRYAGHLCHDLFDVPFRDGERLGFRKVVLVRVDARPGACLVEGVYRLVREVPVGHVERGEVDRRFQSRFRVGYFVELLVARLQALENFKRFRVCGFLYVDFLEAPGQSPILLKDLLVLVVGGRADAAELSRSKGRLEHVRGVEAAVARGARSYDGVDFIDVENNVVAL